MSTTNPSEHIANMLFLMQEVVRADAIASGGAPNPVRLYGQAVAAHWVAARKAMGLEGKWATIEETKAALRAASGGSPGLAAAPQPSAALDFDMAEWGGLGNICMNCLSHQPPTPQGTCSTCGAAMSPE